MTGADPGLAGIRAYATLLRAPEVARLLTGSILGRMQLGMASLAILLLIHSRTGSFASAGLAVGAFGAAGAVLMPFQGRLVDRVGQVHVLVACGIGQSVAFILLAVGARHGASTTALIVLATVAGALLPPLAACMRALWVELVPEPRLADAAYSLDAITQELIWTIGPLLVAVFVTVLSATAAVVACGVLTAVGVALFVSSPLPRRWHAGKAHRSWAGALASSRMRLLLACIAAVSVGTGIVQVAIPAIAVRAHSPASAGVLLGLWSVGSAVGGLASGVVLWRAPIAHRYAALYLCVAVATVPLIWTRSLPAAVAGALIAGLPLAPLLACQYKLVAEAAPPGTVTESFSWNTAAAFGAIAAGNAVGGWLIKHSGLRAAFEAAVAFALLASVAALRASTPIVSAGLDGRPPL